jgi:carbamoyl-phosphate synthase large subunit
VVKELLDLGFEVLATEGTRKVLHEHGLKAVQLTLKIHEGRPNIRDAIVNGQVQLVINTPAGAQAQFDDRAIRRTALVYKVPIITTIAGAKATAAAIRSLQSQPLTVKSLQEYLA